MGFACIAYDTRFLRWSSSSGVITVSERLSSEAIINKGGHKIKYNAQAHDLDCNGDVQGTDVLRIPFKRSILHLSCKFKLHSNYRWNSNAYECMKLEKLIMK